MTPNSQQPWPSEIRLAKDRRALTVAYDNGERFVLPAEYLRVKSPSAEVQGHSPAERITVPGKRNVEILDVLQVGSYAVRLMFDDMHSTGIFSYEYLRELGLRYDDFWGEYLGELEVKGLARDPSR